MFQRNLREGQVADATVPVFTLLTWIRLLKLE